MFKLSHTFGGLIYLKRILVFPMTMTMVRIIVNLFTFLIFGISVNCFFFFVDVAQTSLRCSIEDSGLIFLFVGVLAHSCSLRTQTISRLLFSRRRFSRRCETSKKTIVVRRSPPTVVIFGKAPQCAIINMQFVSVHRRRFNDYLVLSFEKTTQPFFFAFLKKTRTRRTKIFVKYSYYLISPQEN